MQIFYSPQITDIVSLNPEESRHCFKVLRKKVSDQIEITDGKGNLFLYEITTIGIRSCELSLIEQLSKAAPKHHHTHIAIAPTKNMDRMEWFVEKATELGVSEISLVLTKNSERKIAKIDRLKKKAISAIKQSGNLHLPTINEPVTLNDFLSKHKSVAGSKYIAYVPTERTELLFKKAKSKNGYIVLIGPEGDFNKSEVDLTISNGYECVSLGKSVLRTETAGIAAIQQLELLNY